MHTLSSSEEDDSVTPSSGATPNTYSHGESNSDFQVENLAA